MHSRKFKLTPRMLIYFEVNAFWSAGYLQNIILDTFVYEQTKHPSKMILINISIELNVMPAIKPGIRRSFIFSFQGLDLSAYVIFPQMLACLTFVVAAAMQGFLLAGLL